MPNQIGVRQIDRDVKVRAMFNIIRRTSGRLRPRWPFPGPVVGIDIKQWPRRNIATTNLANRNVISAAPAQGAASAMLPSEVVKRRGCRSVLVIDDEENFLTLIRWFLTERGFDIATAASAEASLELIRERAFDVALLDIRLGAADGLSLLEPLTERQPGMKVIVMTAYPTVSSIRQAFDKGASRYLTKPVDLQELSEVIKSL